MRLKEFLCAENSRFRAIFRKMDEDKNGWADRLPLRVCLGRRRTGAYKLEVIERGSRVRQQAHGLVRSEMQCRGGGRYTQT